MEDVENADGVSEVGDDSDKAKLIQALMGSMGGLRVGEKQAEDATHKFWDTQPVPKIGESQTHWPVLRVLYVTVCHSLP